MDIERSRKVCVLVPNGSPRRAAVFLEETGEMLNGVSAVNYCLKPDSTRITVELEPKMVSFYAGAEAVEIEKQMNRLYAQWRNHRNMQRLGIGRFH